VNQRLPASHSVSAYLVLCRGAMASSKMAMRAYAIALLLASLSSAAVAGTCGGYPKTTCSDDHLCCAVDSGDPSGFCCPTKSWRNATFQCAFGIDGLGTGVQPLRNCCEDRPVCGVGVGARYCCMGPRSKRSTSGCSAYGPPVCCNSMCGDDLCDIECKSLGGTCTAGSSTEGGKCTNATTGAPIAPPPLI